MSRSEDLERLWAQEEWGKWNTASLANKMYGKPSKWWDYAMLAAGYSLAGLKIYLIVRMFL